MKPNEKECESCPEWDSEAMICWMDYKKTEDCDFINKVIHLEKTDEEEHIIEYEVE